MKKCHFFEAFILGAIASLMGWFLFQLFRQPSTDIEEEEPISSEDMVQKTLSAIEQGFDNLSAMIEKKS